MFEVLPIDKEWFIDVLSKINVIVSFIFKLIDKNSTIFSLKLWTFFNKYLVDLLGIIFDGFLLLNPLSIKSFFLKFLILLIISISTKLAEFYFFVVLLESSFGLHASEGDVDFVNILKVFIGSLFDLELVNLLPFVIGDFNLFFDL